MDNNKNKQKFYLGRKINCETGKRKSEPSTIYYFLVGKGCRLKKIVHFGEE